MRSADDVEIVGDLPALGVEVAGIGRARADREAVAGDVDADVAGHEARHARAEIGRAEVRRQRAIVQRAVERRVQRVQRRRREHEVVAGDDRVHLVVLAGAAQRQHVRAVVGRRVVVHRVEVAGEERLVGGDRVVDLPERLVLRAVVRDAVLQPSAGIARDGHVLHEVQRHRAEARRIDPVVDEAAGERQLAAAVARRRRDRGEVAVQHRLRRHEADRRRRITVFDAALIAAEQEQLVLDDRRAERAAELIAVQAVALRREEVARVETVVAEELEGVAVHFVRSRLGHQVHRRCGVMPVPRRQRARLHLELLQRVGKRRRQVQVVERIVVRAAVHDVGDAVRLAAGDRDRDRRKILVGVEIACRRGRREAGEENQLGGLSSVQRQLHHALVVDHLADAGVLRLDEGGVRRHRHLLADRADRERDVQLRARSDLQDDAAAHVGVEALQHDLQLVRPDGQVRQRVGAVGAGEHGARHPCIGLRDSDLRARNRTAARVADDAGELRASHRLRPRGAGRDECQSDRTDERA